MKKTTTTPNIIGGNKRLKTEKGTLFRYKYLHKSNC